MSIELETCYIDPGPGLGTAIHDHDPGDEDAESRTKPTIADWRFSGITMDWMVNHPHSPWNLRPAEILFLCSYGMEEP